MKTKIYALRDETRYLRYVGKTSKPLEYRLFAHIREARSGTRNRRCNWIRSMLSRELIPSITLLTEIEGDGCAAEKAWIKFFRSKGVELVNGTEGGDGGATFRGRHHTDLTKKIIGLHHNPNGGMLGKTHSLETKRKMSLTKKGKVFSKEHRLHLSESRKGRKHSEETKRKMRESQKKIPHLWNIGRHLSEETRMKISLGNKGKIISEETRQKLRKSLKWLHLGEKASLETRRKMSESGKKAWEKRRRP